MGRIEMFLRDGRVIDLSGLTPEDAVAKMRALGVRQADIKETRHYVNVRAHPVGCLCGDCETQRIREAEDPRDRRRCE